MIHTEIEWNKVLMTIWGLVLVFEITLNINHPSVIGWAFIGYLVGGLFIMGLNHPINKAKARTLKVMDHLINLQSKSIDGYRRAINEFVEEMKNANKPKRKSKTKR